MKIDFNNRYHRYLVAAGIIWGGCVLCALAGDKTVGAGGAVLTVILGITYCCRGED